MKIKGIRIAYAEAKRERDRYQQMMTVLKEMYSVRKKMVDVAQHEKYGEMVIFDCPEKYQDGKVALSFCLEKCTIKCEDFMYVKKRYPSLLVLVQRLNAKYFKLLDVYEGLKKGLT